MPNDEKLFKFFKPGKAKAVGTGGVATKAFSKVIDLNRTSDSMAEVAIPPGRAEKEINIVKDFRWTKSSSNELLIKNTPTISLREMQVVSPAFFHNLTTALNQLVGDTGVVTSINKALVALGGGEGHVAGASTGIAIAEHGSKTDLTKAFTDGESSVFSGKENIITSFLRSQQFLDFSSNADETIKDWRQKFETFKQATLNHTTWNWPQHLKDYENTYGVSPTRFRYKFPYLEDNYKQVSNSWALNSGSKIASTVSSIANLVSFASPAVGVDLAKTWSYPDSGPSHDVNFFLDNTRYDNHSQYAKNFRFIYLLFYQNLPNRITHSALTPPVIYQASLPGVFSYRWSYISKLNVNFIGTRRPINVQITDDITSTVIIPEGYEVQLTITSLVPETKNFMYDSIKDPVTSNIMYTPAAAKGRQAGQRKWDDPNYDQSYGEEPGALPEGNPPTVGTPGGDSPLYWKDSLNKDARPQGPGPMR